MTENFNQKSTIYYFPTFWLYWILRKKLPKDLSKILCSKEKQWKFTATSRLVPLEPMWLVTGNNEYGQLGLGHKNNLNVWTDLNPPVPFIQISTGRRSTLALSEDGSVWSWGYNGFGQLGFGDKDERLQPSKTSFQESTSSVVAGYNDFSCLLTKHGTVFTCGKNDFGQLGIGSTGEKTSFQKVNIENAVQLQCGDQHNLCLTKDGTLYSWGHNEYGQLGIGTTNDCPSPQKVHILNIETIHCGYYSSHAVLKDGKVWSWGNNDYGQLGIGNTTHQTTAVEVNLADPVLQLSVGFEHVLCFCKNKKLYSWGYNYYGQLGAGTIRDKQASPVEVTVLSSVKIDSIKAVGYSSYVISESRELWGWGSNSYGELGLGHNEMKQSAPVVLSRLSPVVASQFNGQSYARFFAANN